MYRKRSSQATLFRALGDRTRLGIVSRLCAAGPQSTTRLTKSSCVTRQAVTKHLRLMETSGLVHHSRHGRETVWEIENRSIEDARRYLDEISRQWDDALGRLRRFVEE